ncbi:MAG: hypothetical protein IKJ19_08160 [Clostridia bacterium]|nr:hypothetical protein [Clostridia bacterium]
MKNSSYLEHLTQEEREEYLEIINDFKQEFKNKIQDEIKNVREKLSKSTAEILGVEFANLLNERKKLLKTFKSSAKRLLLCAKECGITAELENLEKWSAQAKKEENTKSEGTKLFDEVIQAVLVKNPSIANEVKDIQLELNKNSEQLVQIVKSKKVLIDKLQNSFRAPLQKSIVDLIVEFNKKVAVVNESFNVENIKALSPFDDKDKILTDNDISTQMSMQITDEISEDFDDELFIPLSKNDNNLN